MNIEKPKAVFFDWDGTLADTYSFLNNAHNAILTQMGKPPLKEGEYTEYFGMPRETLYPRIYGEREEEAKRLFEFYVAENRHKIEMIEGADELLLYLHKNKIVMGVVSNKKPSLIALEIEHFGWKSYFSAVVGAGEAEKDKPSGAPLALALKRAQFSHAEETVWYIGDTENDLLCAREAGCQAVLLQSHQDMASLIATYKPLFVAKNCFALREILVAI